jgi:NAD(P)-dependent dehydrogenase (short-subunit alcohol dehydrogenase family)
MNLENRTILITGANRGIGRALVEEALKRGVKRVYAGTRSSFEHSDKRVTPLILDVTNADEIQRAADEVGTLDILINNAGIAMYDDLTKPEVIKQHLAVNLFGPLNVTRAFLPLLKRSQGAVINNLSTSALAPMPIIPGYSISKAAALSMTQSLRALLSGQGVSVHASLTGPVDTDMTRSVDFPKAPPQSVAVAIFDGLERGEEEIFPDPVSQSIADGWRNGVAKVLERQQAVFIPENMTKAA